MHFRIPYSNGDTTRKSNSWDSQLPKLPLSEVQYYLLKNKRDDNSVTSNFHFNVTANTLHRN